MNGWLGGADGMCAHIIWWRVNIGPVEIKSPFNICRQLNEILLFMRVFRTINNLNINSNRRANETCTFRKQCNFVVTETRANVEHARDSVECRAIKRGFHYIFRDPHKVAFSWFNANRTMPIISMVVVSNNFRDIVILFIRDFNLIPLILNWSEFCSDRHIYCNEYHFFVRMKCCWIILMSNVDVGFACLHRSQSHPHRLAWHQHRCAMAK